MQGSYTEAGKAGDYNLKTNPDKFLQALTSNYKLHLAFSLYFGAIVASHPVIAASEAAF